jgi:hypothetical protein
MRSRKAKRPRWGVVAAAALAFVFGLAIGGFIVLSSLTVTCALPTIDL